MKTLNKKIVELFPYYLICALCIFALIQFHSDKKRIKALQEENQAVERLVKCVGEELDKYREEIRVAKIEIELLKLNLDTKIKLVEATEDCLRRVEAERDAIDNDRKYAWEQSDTFARMARENRQEMEMWQETATERKQQLDRQAKQ